jgi:Flp pilus assembly pilin Flp
MFEQIGLRIAMALNGASNPLRRDEGQTLVEYALIIVTISIGVTAAMLFLRDQIRTVFTQIGNAL